MQKVRLFLSVLLAFTTSTNAARKPANSVLLSQVKTLTLRDGQKTSHRRVSPLPQLTCIGGNGKGLYNVDIMRCDNSGGGYDAEDIQWSCKASLPPEFKLGSTDVVCEGYDSPKDTYVLKGSCGVEYRLLLTELGEQKYGKNAFDKLYRGSGLAEQSTASSIFTVLFWGVFIAIVCLFLYRTFGGQRAARNLGSSLGGNFGGFGGGGGGGGNDGHDDPPPPYMPRAPKPASSYRANQSTSSRSRSQNTDQAWRPGFWTGTAAGAAAGYAAGRAGGANRNAGRYYDPLQPGPSSWFGRTREPDYGFGAPRPTYGGGGSSMFGSGAGASSTASSSRQESAGFGGTRRR